MVTVSSAKKVREYRRFLVVARVIVRAFDMEGLRYGCGRLRGQALLAYGACGEDQCGAAPAGRAASGRAVRTLLAGRPDYRLRRTPGDGGGASGAADAHRVRVALRAFGPRRAGVDPLPAAATGLGTGEDREVVKRLRRFKQVSPIGWGMEQDEIAVSGIGTIAAARVRPRDSSTEPFIVVSMYGYWVGPHPSRQDHVEHWLRGRFRPPHHLGPVGLYRPRETADASYPGRR